MKHRLYKHSKDVTALSFRDGTNSLYSGGLDRSLIVWDAFSGSWQETLVGPTEPVTCLHGLDKQNFVCSGMDKAIQFFKVISSNICTTIIDFKKSMIDFYLIMLCELIKYSAISIIQKSLRKIS